MPFGCVPFRDTSKQRQIELRIWSLQCLSAVCPFGTMTSDEYFALKVACLQCLSAVCPFGTDAYAKVCAEEAFVFNAFRLCALSGRLFQADINQRLRFSVFNAFRLCALSGPKISVCRLAFRRGSSMPFGCVPFRDGARLTACVRHQLGLQCLSAVCPFGTPPL